MEALYLPFGELMDLIAIEQIETMGFKRKKTLEESQNEVFNFLTWR